MELNMEHMTMNVEWKMRTTRTLDQKKYEGIEFEKRTTTKKSARASGRIRNKSMWRLLGA